MGSFSRKRPSFDQFRRWFLEEAERITGRKVDDSFMPWVNAGTEETRDLIVESFMLLLESKFGFRPLLNERLSQIDGSYESVAMRIFHIFSTMFLVDHINDKMYKQKNNQIH